ncbi:MAG: FG-GAP repeat domain-containing protein, partial [Vicinamibacterales bacterium]
TAARNDAIVLSIGEVLDSEIDPGFWPWIRLYGPNGALLGSNWGNWAVYLTATAPLTGTYTVVVGTADSANDATGDYLFTLAKIPGTFVVPTGDQGGAMTNGASHPGTIHLGDLDQWTFYAAQGAALVVSIGEVATQPDPGFWPWIRIFGPTGVLVRSTWGDVAAQASFAAPLTGTYTVVVGTADSANDATGRYLLQATGISAPPALERIAFGLGPMKGAGGWFALRADRSRSFAPAGWRRLPWSAYNTAGGGLRLAAGDVDGDGLDEIVAGLDRGGAGWIAVLDDAAHGYALLRWLQVQWPTYNAANGEVWPAVGDLDGDGRAEIVAGLGAGGYGWFEVFDDATAGFSHVAWKQIAWPAYATLATSVVHPAVGNVDGAGASEIILGLGVGSGGWIEVVNGAAGGYNHRSWFQVTWSAYNAANGTTFPAAGDVDGDGRAEVVAGLGTGSGGWVQLFEDASGSYAHVTWLRVSWAAYNQGPGETHPAAGDLDGDSVAEIVIGLGSFAGQGGWFETFDDKSAGFVSLGWRNLDWVALRAAGGATYPAIGRFR